MADAIMSSVRPLAPSPAALRAELRLAIRSQDAGGKRQARVRQRGRSWATDLCGSWDHSWWSPRGPAAPSIPTQRRSDAFGRRACPASTTTTHTTSCILRDRSLLPALPPPPSPPSPLPPSPSPSPPTGSRRSATSSRSQARVLVAHCQAGEGDRDSPGRDDLHLQSRSSVDGGDPVVGSWDPNDQTSTTTTSRSSSSIAGADLGPCHESLATTAADGNTSGGESRVAREWSRNRRRRSRRRREGENILWRMNGALGLEFEPLTSWRCSALRVCLFILRAHRPGTPPAAAFSSVSSPSPATTASSSSSSASQSSVEDAMATRKMEGALVALGGDTAMAATKEQQDRAEAREQQDRAVEDERVSERRVNVETTESACVVSDLLTSSERDLGSYYAATEHDADNAGESGDGGDGGDINVAQGDPPGNGNGGFTSSSSSSLADDIGTSSRAIEAETEVIPSSSSSSSSSSSPSSPSSSSLVEIARTDGTADDETRKLSGIESRNSSLDLNIESNLSSCPLESASSELTGELFLDRRRDSSAEEGRLSVPTANLNSSHHRVRDDDDEDKGDDGDRDRDLNSRRRGMSWNSDRDPDFESSLDDSREGGEGEGEEDGPDPSEGRPGYRDHHRDTDRAMCAEGQAKTEGKKVSSSSSTTSSSPSSSGSQLDRQSSFCTTTDELHCGVVHPGALSRTKTTITTDSRSKTAVVAVESSVTFTGDDSSSSSLEVDDYLALAENCVLKRASELMNKTRREQLMMSDTGDTNGRTAEVYEKHRAIVSVLEEGKVVAARPTQPPSIFGHESFFLQLRDPRTGLKANAIFKPRVGDGDAEGWHRPPIELVAYKLNLMLGMDYVPPVAYRTGAMNICNRHFNEGAFIYFVPKIVPLRTIPASKWGVSVARLLSDTRILDVLLHNSDRHHGHFLYGQHWVTGAMRPVLIDHAAGFRKGAEVRMDHENAFQTGPVRCVHAKTYLRLKFLDLKLVRENFHGLLTEEEMTMFLQRRDMILSYLEKLVDCRGYHSAVLES